MRTSSKNSEETARWRRGESSAQKEQRNGGAAKAVHKKEQRNGGAGKLRNRVILAERSGANIARIGEIAEGGFTGSRFAN